ncbi:MAG: hypothetical protein IJ179_00240 [Oscillospiraceae bacterium]|nr:hypothetical protein [Oscillospiraceae bacterium]
MKKTLSIVLSLFLLCLCACGNTAAPTAAPAVATPVQTQAPAPTAAPAAISPTAHDGIDVDLTMLGSTMVYSEVYNMMYEPEAYMGKVVKMQGAFSSFEGQDRMYFACVVADATACCAQGIEFELDDSYAYPQDYPELGDEITVVGTFSSYTEEYNGNSYEYIYLENAQLA